MHSFAAQPWPIARCVPPLYGNRLRRATLTPRWRTPRALGTTPHPSTPRCPLPTEAHTSFLDVLRRQWRLGAIFGAALLLGVLAAEALRAPVFVATATLEVLARPGHELSHSPVRDDEVRGYFEVLQQQRTLAQRVQSPSVIATAGSRVGVDAQDLARRLRIEPQPQSALVHVRVHNADPDRAAAEANAVAAAATDAARDTRRRDARDAADWLATAQEDAKLPAALRDALSLREQELRLASKTQRGPLQQVVQATPPSQRDRPALRFTLSLALLAAGAGGMAITLLADALDDRVASPEHAEALTGLPLIGLADPRTLQALAESGAILIGAPPADLPPIDGLQVAPSPAQSLSGEGVRLLLVRHHTSRRQLVRTARALRALRRAPAGLLWHRG